MRAQKVLAAAVMALAAAGCGGDEPSKAEYIAQADRVCKRATAAELRARRLFARGQQGGGQASARRITSALDSLVSTEVRTLRELKAMPRPEGDDGKVAGEYITSLDRDISLLRAYATAVKGRDRAAGQRALAQLNARQGASSAIARRYGFKVCSRG